MEPAPNRKRSSLTWHFVKAQWTATAESLQGSQNTLIADASYTHVVLSKYDKATSNIEFYLGSVPLNTKENERWKIMTQNYLLKRL